MVRFLIADDEEWVRIGIKEQIDYDNLALELVGEASNGEDALKLVREFRPNIVITDIRMPIVDGIRLMKYLYKEFPEILIIVLSGYAEFDYAKKSIEYKVFDYILKPIEKKILNDVLGKAIMQIEEETARKLFMHNKSLTELVDNPKASSEYIKDILSKAKKDFDYEFLSVLVVKITEIEGVSPKLIDIVKELLDDESNSIIFNNNIKSYIIIIRGYERKDTDMFFEDTSIIAEKIKTNIDKFDAFHVNIGIGNLLTINEINRSYLQAAECAQFAGFIQYDGVLRFENLHVFNGCELFDNNAEKMFVAYLENCERENALESVEGYFYEVAVKWADANSIRKGVHQIIKSILGILKKYQITLDIVDKEDYIVYKTIESFETLWGLKVWLLDIVGYSIDRISNNRKSGVRKNLPLIIAFLKNNYYKNINLDSVAGIFFINPKYLSKVFKTEQGQNFNDYLNRIRIEKACELLLNSSLKTSEISEMVGYENPNYFSVKFRDYYGCTPTEYRANNTKEEKLK